MGMSEPEFQKAVADGKVLAKDIVKFTRQLRKNVAPGLEKAVKSLTAEQARMINNLDRMRDTLFTGGLERGTKRVIELFNTLINITSKWLKSGWATFIGSTIEGFSLSAELAFALIHDAVVAMSKGWGLLFESMGMTKKTADELKAMFMDKGGLVAGGLLFLYVMGRILAVFKLIRRAAMATAAIQGAGDLAGGSGGNPPGNGRGATARKIMKYGLAGTAAIAALEYKDEILDFIDEKGMRHLHDFASQFKTPEESEAMRKRYRERFEALTGYQPPIWNAREATPMDSPMKVEVNINAGGLEEFFDIKIEKNNKDIGWSVLKSIPSN